MANGIKRLAALCLLPFFPSYVVADTLAEIYELALKNDSTLRIAKAQYDANKENKIQARASLLPQIAVQGTTSDTNRSTTNRSSSSSDEFENTLNAISSGSFSDGNTHGYSASLNQTVFSLEKWYNYKQGYESDHTVEATYQLSQQDLVLRVATAYFDVLRGIDNLASAKAEEKAIKRQLEQTQQRFDVGLIAITDVHEARAAYDSVIVTRLELEGALAINYEALEVLTGQTHQQLNKLAEDFLIEIPSPVNREAWVKIALENNIEIRSAQFAVRSAEANAKAKKYVSYPTLDASASFNHSSTGTDTTVYELSLSMPLYTGGFNRSASRQAYQQLNEAKETLVNAKRNITQQTRSAYLSVSTDVAKVKARRLSITSRQSALDATQAGYDVGTRNVVDVLDAQKDLYEALRNYANARYDYIINLLRLKKAAGTLNEQDIHWINQGLTPNDVPLADLFLLSNDFHKAG